MSVAVDVSPLAQTRAGTARYIRNLLAHLQVDVRRVAFGGPNRAATLVRELWWYPVELRGVDADVLHCTTYRGPLRPRVPLVVTVHDLAVFRHPAAFRPWTRTYSRLVVPQVVRGAARVIAVSEFTRRELVELLGVPEERIRVVPNAVSGPFAADGPAADGDYVLAVGTLEPRKNLPRLVEASKRAGVELLGVPEERIRVVPNAVSGPFAADGPAAEGDYVLAVGTLEPRKNLPRLVEASKRAGVELRVVGARGWGGVAVSANGVRWLGEVGDDELARLYRGARAVAYPSVYEGFGIPVLEAMACGAPVVTSRGGATEEVAGGAAVLVDPLDVAAIATGLDEADRRREELRPLGLERARSFSWAEVARRTERVYEEASGA